MYFKWGIRLLISHQCISSGGDQPLPPSQVRGATTAQSGEGCGDVDFAGGREHLGCVGGGTGHTQGTARQQLECGASAVQDGVTAITRLQG